MIDASSLLRFFSRHRLEKLRVQNARETQENVLRALVRKASRTTFGKDHGFHSIRTVEDYQSRVPLRYYEDFWNTYWKSHYPKITNSTWPGTIPYFALTSGTTSGTTKYIPVTHEMIRSNTKGGLDLLAYHVGSKPKSKLFGGKIFMLGGSTDLLEPAPGIFSGDLSGIAARTMPWWTKGRSFPPEDIALLKNWEEKISILAQKILEEDVRMISGVPSWLLIFFSRVFEIAPEHKQTIAEIFPRLEMLVHGGVNFSPYHTQFKDLLSGSRAELREVYPASEGFLASSDKGFGEGLRLTLDHGIFFEFVPLDELASSKPTRHWVGNVELDVNYAVVLSTCAGIWSYILGDTVKFVSRDPHRILVTGRTSYTLSAFGEHLIADEVEDAVSTAADTIRATLSDYSVGAIYPSSPEELGGHLYIVEFQNPQPSSEAIKIFTDCIDKKLCARNEDYEAHRAKGFGLRPPSVKLVKPGTFAGWMESRGKLGGQNKVPRLISNRELFDGLAKYADLLK